jgi:nitroreductase
MDVAAAITGRRAVRAYRPQALDEPAIRQLIDAAVQAPSAANQQPWAFTVVRDQRVLERLSAETKSYVLAHLPAGRDLARFHGRLDDPQFHIFYRAPVLILISGVAPGPWIIEDCSLAAENLMLAACAAGLGSCWIGFAQSYLNTPEGKSLLQIPSAWVPVAPIIVGHPSEASAPVLRRAPEIRWIG